MSVRSMTGFAHVRKNTGHSDVALSVKSVNHRGLDLHFRMPPEFDAFEPALRATVKRHISRGHLQIQVRYTTAQTLETPLINVALLDAYLEAFHKMSAVHGLHGEPDLNAAFRVPGMFDTGDTDPDPKMEAVLAEALDEALVTLNAFREREGAEIAADMRARNVVVLQNARQMEELRARAVPEFQARLNQRLGELLEGAAVEPQRLAQEVAFLADRSDISEELTRLKVHAVQLHDLLASSGEVGKKLDFLLQEMQRETNTILSKSTGIGETGLELTDLALAVKAEIEKIREQGLNLE